MKLYQCSNGHVLLDYQNGPSTCFDCDEPNDTVFEIRDYNFLMGLAEKEEGTEMRHIYAEQAMYLRLNQIDEKFAKRFEKVRDIGGWYFS